MIVLKLFDLFLSLLPNFYIDSEMLEYIGTVNSFLIRVNNFINLDALFGTVLFCLFCHALVGVFRICVDIF